MKIRCALLHLALTIIPVALPAAEVAYSFSSPGGGGLAVVAVETDAHTLGATRRLIDNPACTKAMKVRFTPDGRRLVLTHESKSSPLLYLVDRADGKVRTVTLPGEPDEVRVTAHLAVATCGDGLATVDLDKGTLLHTFNAERELSPTGHGPEDVLLLPGETEALVSFQKDSKTGRHQGNRIALFSLPDLRVLADMPLPRNRPDLHIRDNPREQGPGPEVLLWSEATDTLFVTLDLYGAVALCSASAFQHGQFAGLYLSTALDDTWGQSFPDRAALCPIGDRELALVVNAGTAGGAVMVDLAGRRIVHRFPTPPGLDHPLPVNNQGLAVAACAGKIKYRGEGRTEKDAELRAELYVFDLHATPPAMEIVPFDQPVFAAALVAKGDTPLLVLGARGAETDELLLYDLDSRRILARTPAAGRIRKLEAYAP